LVRANHRQHRVLGCRPADRVEADKTAIRALPPVGPSFGWRSSTRLPRDHYVRCDGNHYSVYPATVGRRIEVTADLARVRVWCQGTMVADHERILAKRQKISDPDHVDPAKLLRRNHFYVIGPPTHVEVEQRRLTDYDLAS
jgi:transposase